MTARRLRNAFRTASVAAGVGVLAVTSGCSLWQSEPRPTPTPTASAEQATLQPDGFAEENQPYFDQVNNATIARVDDGADGRVLIDGLVDAGFNRDDMELTPDSTSIGLEADAIEFSVRWGEQCLIGQYGGGVGYNSTVTETLAGERCLIGTTRPIDWD